MEAAEYIYIWKTFFTFILNRETMRVMKPLLKTQALDTNSIYVIIQSIFYIKNIVHFVYRLYNNVY